MQINKNTKTNADKLKEEFYEGMAELRKRQEKTDEQLKKTDEKIEKTRKMVGELTDGWGKFVEGLVLPSIPKLFEKLGIKIPTIYQRAKAQRDGDYLEIDVLAVGERKDGKEILILTEVKNNLKVQDVQDCIENFKNFFKYFKEYKGREFIGVVAGIRLETEVEKYAEKKGLYILAPSGDTMEILNKKGFKPKIWRGR